MIDNSYPGWSKTNLDTTIQNNPTNFIRDGYYAYGTGNLANRNVAGFYWLPRAYSVTNARYLYHYSALLDPQYNYYKGSGFSIRCLVR